MPFLAHTVSMYAYDVSLLNISVSFSLSDHSVVGTPGGLTARSVVVHTVVHFSVAMSQHVALLVRVYR